MLERTALVQARLGRCLILKGLAERVCIARQDAMHTGPRETLAYIPAVQPKEDKPDYLMTVDLDPASATYSQVKHQALELSPCLHLSLPEEEYHPFIRLAVATREVGHSSQLL